MCGVGGRAGCRVDGAGGEIRERRAGGRHDPPDDEKEEGEEKEKKMLDGKYKKSKIEAVRSLSQTT